MDCRPRSTGTSTRRRSSISCPPRKSTDAVQAITDNGILGENVNLPLPILKQRVGSRGEGAYSYVLSTINLNPSTLGLEQGGSAPNFQGGILTLCTCKHRLRTFRKETDWPEVWIAGFASRTLHQGRHWLFYLSQISAAYESHSDLWHALSDTVRIAKAAHLNYLGDVFEPKGPLSGETRFNPKNYVAPTQHSHLNDKNPTGWHNDVRYNLRNKYGDPPLLVGDPKLTFIWDAPIVHYSDDHPRQKKWTNVTDLLEHLESSQS